MTDSLQFNLHGSLSFLSGVFTLGMGVFVLCQNIRSTLHQRFFALSVAPAMWMMCFGMMSLAKNPDHSVFWLKLAYLLGVPFISPGVFAFSECWSGRNRKLLMIVGYFFGAAFAVVMAVFQPSLLLVHELPWGRFDQILPSLESQLYYTLFSIFFIGYAGLSIRNFWLRLKSARNPHERAQARNVLIGIGIAYTGAVDFLAVFGWNVYPFGYLSVTALMTIIAYTIVQHQAFDIRILAKRLGLLILIYSLLALFVIPVGFAVFDHLIANSTSVKTVCVIVGLTSGLLFSSGPLIYARLVKRSYWLRGYNTMGLVHELKSPLSTIESATDLLSGQLETGALNPNDLKSYLGMIERNTSRLQGFIRNLLTIAKDQGELVLQKSTFNFGAMIEAQRQHYEPLAQQKGLRIEIQKQGDISVFGDEDKLAQVVSNLLSNAIKFSSSGTIIIEYHLISQTELLCEIRDQGRGLRPDQQQRIFERFIQLDVNQSGTGIGLTIARIWIEAHHGKIWAESEGEGRGTRFKFTLGIK